MENPPRPSGRSDSAEESLKSPNAEGYFRFPANLAAINLNQGLYCNSRALLEATGQRSHLVLVESSQRKDLERAFPAGSLRRQVVTLNSSCNSCLQQRTPAKGTVSITLLYQIMCSALRAFIFLYESFL